jgi:TolB-like protein/Tfp pilus assembly protein PilF
MRKLLGDCGGGQCYIETVPRVGYRFIATVEKTSMEPVTVEEPRKKACLAKSVAVLYFENLSRDGADEYFRDGITEDVITELAKIREICVFPRSAVLAYRDTPLPAAQVGQKLSAAYVLEGSIRRAGNRLRVTAGLTETATGHSAWAERYDGGLEDVFAIQDEIAKNIAQALRVMLSDQERDAIEKVPTRDIQAYDYYLRGRQFFYQGRRQDLEFARQMFARAIEIDPGYSRAYAGMADACSFLAKWFHNREDNLQHALDASRRAVQLDPDSCEARASRGLAEFLSGNHEFAQKEFERALALDPGSFEASYFYGRSCVAQGNFEKAAELFQRAGHVCRDDYQAPALLGMVLRKLNRHEEATEVLRDALRRAEEHLRLNPDDVRAVSLSACAFSSLGQHERALQWLDRALALAPEDAAILYNAGCTFAKVHETAKAIDCLEKALRLGFWHKGWMENDPDLESLRKLPRFQRLMEEFEADFTLTS